MEAVNAYFSSVNKVSSPLTFEREIELSKIIQEGKSSAQKAVDELVKANLKFAISIARQYQGRGVPLEDLINEANIGLIKAAWRFDGNMGFRFISYAVHWIRQSIMESCFKTSRSVRLPLSQVGNLNKINKVIASFEQENGRPASLVEIAALTGLDESDIDNLLVISKQSMSLDKGIESEDDECGTLKDLIAGESETQIEAEKEDLHDTLDTIMKSVLTERECLILKETFGIDEVAKDLEDIAKQLNITAERVRQLTNKALMKLRTKTSKEQLRVFLG